MNNPFLVGVADCTTDLQKKFQPLSKRELPGFTELSQVLSQDQLHHHIRASRLSLPGIKHPGDVGMIHPRERLPFSLKAGQDFAGVHPGLDHLDGDLTLQRMSLRPPPDHTEASLPDSLDQQVRANVIPQLLDARKPPIGNMRHHGGSLTEERLRPLGTFQQAIDLPEQALILPAGCLQVLLPFLTETIQSL